jgi:hypothetical protein
MDRRRTVVAPGLLVLGLLAPAPARAQMMGGFAPAPVHQTGWMPISIGPRGGYESRSSSLVLGAGARIPVIPSAALEILPSFDVTFLSGLKEYEYNLEAVYAYGDRNGALYAGGGLAWRNTIFDNQRGRETKRGRSIVIGVRSNPPDAHFGTQIEMRWIFVDPVLKPRVFSFGINVPLW